MAVIIERKAGKVKVPSIDNEGKEVEIEKSYKAEKKPVSIYSFCSNLKFYEGAGWKVVSGETDDKSKARIKNFIVNSKKK